MPRSSACRSPVHQLPVYYRQEYVLAGHRFETTRKARWIAESLVRNPLSGVELTAPEPLAEAEVSAVHDPAYVAAVRTGRPRAVAESQGFRWDPGLWPMVLASNGGVVAAALAARRSGIAGSLSSGLHHARRVRGNGYCTFNGLALAARAVLAAGAHKVLILDLDAHCGGGTHELLGADPNVWIVDVAVHTFDGYTPTGHNTLDVVPAAECYLPTVRARLDALPTRAPAFDVCLYNAGMDPYQRCAIGGLKGIDRSMLEERERLVFGWCRRQRLPIAFVLAGGYLGRGLDKAGLTDLHRLTLATAAATASQQPT